LQSKNANAEKHHKRVGEIFKTIKMKKLNLEAFKKKANVTEVTTLLTQVVGGKTPAQDCHPGDSSCSASTSF
jgi:hypothetical protein